LAPATFAPLLGDFCAAAPVPVAATFDKAAFLAPALAVLLGIALSFAATALLLGIAPAFAALLGGVVTFEREAAMLLG